MLGCRAQEKLARLLGTSPKVLLAAVANLGELPALLSSGQAPGEGSGRSVRDDKIAS